MKQKLASLRALALSNRRYVAALGVSLVAAPAFADAAGTGATDANSVLSNVLPTLVGSLLTAMGTTITQVGPIIALACGIAFAVRMVRKQAK